MTDKQIIIDEIDVSGCKYWKGYCRIASLCDYPGHLCEVTSNCYYKQLKRKEQECKNNKIAHQMELDIFNQECLNLIEDLKAKEQECKDLKSAFVRAECQIADDEILQCDMREAIEELKAENENWQKEYWKLEQGNDFLAEKNSRLRGCFTKIKEIAEHCMKQDICTTCDNSEKCHIEDEEIPTYDVCKLILQKISECEGNDER